MTKSISSAILYGLTRLYPFLKSKTGNKNPRVKHTTGFGFALRAFLTLRPNMDKWLIGNDCIFPTVLQVQTINRCNAKCKMCPYPYTTGNEKYQEMEDDLWKKISDECSKEESLRILVPMSKNEPLLDKRMTERVAYFRKRALPHQEIEIVTNGSNLNGGLMKDLSDSGLDMVTISLSASDPSTYNNVMDKLRWDKIMKNINEIKKLDLGNTNVFVRFIRQKDNYKQASKFKRKWQKMGFNVLTYDVNNRSGAVMNYKELLEPKTLVNSLRKFIKKKLSRKIFPVCPHAFSFGSVLSNGDMPLCANDWHNKVILGNVKKNTIKEIYNSKKANKIRGLMKDNRYDLVEPCKNCSFWINSEWL